MNGFFHPLEHVFALLLILLPANDSPVPSPDASHRPLMFLAYNTGVMCQLCESWKEEESSRVFWKLEDFGTDRAILSTRWREVCNCRLPRLEEIYRFPHTTDETRPLKVLNNRYREWLEFQVGMKAYQQEAIWETITEVTLAHHAWDMLDSAAMTSHCMFQRRRYLGELREAIGPARFAAGDMPEIVPTRMFQHVR